MNQDSNSQIKSMVIAYPLNNALYLNITNRCTNACLFCIRNTDQGIGYNLWLEHEPTADEIIRAIGNPVDYQEIVFCGYGEPLLRPEIIVEVAIWLKRHPVQIRLNTNGLADLFLEYDILPKLKGLIDVISISLNASDPETYLKLTKSKFGLKAYAAVLEFARRSIMYIPRVILSVVDFPGVDLTNSAQIAKEIGAEFRIRQMQGE